MHVITYTAVFQGISTWTQVPLRRMRREVLPPRERRSHVLNTYHVTIYHTRSYRENRKMNKQHKKREHSTCCSCVPTPDVLVGTRSTAVRVWSIELNFTSMYMRCTSIHDSKARFIWTRITSFPHGKQPSEQQRIRTGTRSYDTRRVTSTHNEQAAPAAVYSRRCARTDRASSWTYLASICSVFSLPSTIQLIKFHWFSLIQQSI